MNFRNGTSPLAIALGAMSPAEQAKGRYMRAPDAHGAADLVPADAPPADAPPADAPPAADAPPPADAEWLAHFSAEGGDADNPSNRDWLKGKGFKTLDDLAKSYRAAEHTIRNGNKIGIPGDDAKPEEIAAFRKAIGVPDKPEDYAITLPEGVKEDELDMGLIDGLRSKALEAGVPAKGFDALVQNVIQGQLDSVAAEKSSEDEARDALFKEWGKDKDSRLADFNNAIRALGLRQADVVAMQRGFRLQYGEPGTPRTMKLLQKLGAGLAEDSLLHADGPRRFGVTGEEAQKEIDTLIEDKTFDPVKNPDHKARWDRLNAAVAADKDRKAARAASGG